MSKGNSDKPVKDELPNGEDTPVDLEGRQDVKIEPELMAENLDLPMEEKPKVTTAFSSSTSDPPGLSRSYTLAGTDSGYANKGKCVVWQDQRDPNNNNARAQDTSSKGEPSKRPDMKPPSMTVSVTVSQTDGVCGDLTGQFSDAEESEEAEDGTQMSSTMLMSSSTAESSVHGSSWDR